MKHYFSMTHVISGFIAVLVGFVSSAVLIVQAATAAGASPAELSSWLWALGIGVSLTSIGFSLTYRMPILTAWSTPGAALLVSSLSGVPMRQAVGAFIFAAALSLFVGLSGWFEKIMVAIPRSLAAAMLAGTLLHFGLNVFLLMPENQLMVSAMLISYLIGKKYYPRYVLLMVLAVGTVVAAWEGLVHFEQLSFSLSMPIFIWPEFSVPVLFSVGLPLFLVTMTSQNIPGLTVLRAAGYQPPISRIISIMGGVGMLMAPFGGFSLNLAAITAAICANEEADLNPLLRYRSTLCAGFFYLLMGIFAAVIVALFTSFPKALVLAVAGLALFGTLASNLKEALDSEKHRESSIITFLVAASGLNLFGISAAFWGLTAGLLTLFFLEKQENGRSIDLSSSREESQLH